jgi:hypothetical protein
MPRSNSPVKATTEWVEPDAPEIRGEVVSKAGRHHGAEYVQRSKERNREDRARYLRNYGGRERDARRIPPPEHQLSGRTSKSSSKIRFATQAFRRGYRRIDWRK